MPHIDTRVCHPAAHYNRENDTAVVEALTEVQDLASLLLSTKEQLHELESNQTSVLRKNKELIDECQSLRKTNLQFSQTIGSTIEKQWKRVSSKIFDCRKQDRNFENWKNEQKVLPTRNTLSKLQYSFHAKCDDVLRLEFQLEKEKRGKKILQSKYVRLRTEYKEMLSKQIDVAAKPTTEKELKKKITELSQDNEQLTLMLQKQQEIAKETFEDMKKRIRELELELKDQKSQKELQIRLVKTLEAKFSESFSQKIISDLTHNDSPSVDPVIPNVSASALATIKRHQKPFEKKTKLKQLPKRY